MIDPAPPVPVVLYVEDEEHDAFFMQLAFERAGLASSLRTVGDARQAIEYLSGVGRHADPAAKPRPDLVLLDLNLPVMSGFELLEWIRGEPAYRTLPVVIFSSSSRTEDQHRATALGANGFLAKPNSARLFSDVVARLRTEWLRA